jgi:hypothetical protein
MKKRNITKWSIVIPLVLVILAVISLIVVHTLAGRRPGVRGLKTFLKSFILSALYSQEVKSNSNGVFTSIIFLHQSTGRNLIDQGKVRELFQQGGYDFWDHDYNYIGLRNPDGRFTGYSYNVPDDNTYPDGLAGIFKQPAYQLPFNTFSGLIQHEVIILKSCFPTSDIPNEDELDQLKDYYLGIRSRMDRYPNKIFVVMTQPPLNPAETTPEVAVRARALADWLKSDDFLKGHPNIFTFDFYSYLADDQPSSPAFNMLRKEYQNGTDSHPNRLANETIGPEFVQFVIQSIRIYRKGN